jgi:hypothetical protein
MIVMVSCAQMLILEHAHRESIDIGGRSFPIPGNREVWRRRVSPGRDGEQLAD